MERDEAREVCGEVCRGQIRKSLLVLGSGELGLCSESRKELWRLFFLAE